MSVEPAVDSSDIAGDCPGFRIGCDVFPFGWFGTARDDQAVVGGAENEGL